MTVLLSPPGRVHKSSRDTVPVVQLRTRARARSLASLAIALAAIATPLGARAEPKIEIEPRGELMFGDDAFGREIFGGPGLAFLFGYALDTYPALLMPELMIAGAFYPGELAGSARVAAGFRAGFTTIVEPSIYTHLGYGVVPNELEVGHAFTIDAGLTLDKRLSREVTLGGSLGYQGFVYERSFHGLTAGFHVGFWL